MKKTIAAMLAGAVLGASLLGGAYAAVETVSAQRSTNAIYIDGQRVELEAYAIGGHNYVKLRDVGKAVGFNVSWDGSAVQIDSTAPYEDETPTQTGKAVNLPADGSKYVPKVGDCIPCDDGTTYIVTDVQRWEDNAASSGALPELPTPTCDWSLYGEAALPAPRVKHYNDAAGNDLLVYNGYETRRMQYTIYNALGSEPSAWKDGKPLATVELTIPDEYAAYAGNFWPWQESQLTDLVHSRANSRFYVSAWDFYHNGSFQYTRYCVLSL